MSWRFICIVLISMAQWSWVTAADASCNVNDPPQRNLSAFLSTDTSSPSDIDRCSAVQELVTNIISTLNCIKGRKNVCDLPRKPDVKSSLVTEMSKFYRELAWVEAQQSYMTSREKDGWNNTAFLFNNTLGDLQHLIAFVNSTDPRPILETALPKRPVTCSASKVEQYTGCVLDKMRSFMEKACGTIKAINFRRRN